MDIKLRTALYAGILYSLFGVLWLQWIGPKFTGGAAPALDLAVFVVDLVKNAVLFPVLVWVAAKIAEEMGKG